MRKKKSSLTTTLIIILLIIVGGIFTYIYIQDKKLETNNQKEEKDIIKKVKEEEIALDSEEVINAINDMNNISAIDIYDNYNVSNIDKYRLIITAINGLENDQITWCISSPRQISATISIDDLNNSLNKYIKDKKITIDDIKENKGETGLTVGQYGYDRFAISIDGDNIHIIGSCDGSGPGIQQEIVKTNLVKATKKKDELYIYTKVAYGKLNQTANELSYDYYLEKNSEEIIETVSLDNDLTWEKYNTYKQTYKKIDDKYYFQSSKKD